MIFVIPIEVKKRELLSRLYLSYNILKKKKNKVILSKSRMILYESKKMKNVVYLDKSISTHKNNITEKILKNNFVSVIDEEGPINNWPELFREIRLPRNIFLKKNFLNYFIRNNIEKNILKKKKIKNLTKVKNIGHPKFELLQKPIINIFNNEVLKIKKKFGNFVLINSSFMKDSIINFELYRLFLEKNYGKNRNQKKLLKKYISQIKNDEKNYFSLINLTISLAKQNPNFSFVFRCHPRQDINLVIKRFPKNLKNLHITNKYSAMPWLIACAKFIHCHCTTVYEAAFLKKEIYSLRVDYNTFQDKNLNTIGYSFKDSQKLIDFFISVERKKEKYDYKKVKLNNNILVNNINHDFCKKFLENFKNIKEIKSEITFYKNKKNRNFEFVRKFLINIKRIISSSNAFLNLNKYFYISDNFLFSNKYKSSKIDSLKVKEVKSILKKIYRINKEKYTLKVYSSSNNTVTIVNK